MPITAIYNGVTRKLAVAGDALANSLIFTRDIGGTIFVNGGSVAVSGGTPTIANTDLVEASGFDLNDVITLDETNGALPAASMLGGNGNDTLTGGSGGDTLSGEAGDDVLLGKGGNDTLFGGLNNDTLTGGTGADTMNGDDGNDRMIWNPGDGSDVMEGGLNSDTAEVNGGNGAEVFTVTANGTRVRFDRVDPAPFLLDIGTTEVLELHANGGDDSISTSGNLAALIALTLDGGAGNDTILGGNGSDQLLGGDGNDFIDGNQGNDVAFLGIGDDAFQWEPGDGSDTVEGQAGTDQLIFNGNGAVESFAMSANGARLQLTRDVGSIVMDINDVEVFTVNAGAGSDSVAVNDLAGTDATQVTVNLAGTIGGSTGDAAIDFVTVAGSAGANTIDVFGAGTALSVTGTPATVGINQIELTDRLTVNGGAGNDIVNASTVGSGIAQLVLDGGANDDDIRGSAGADQLFGSDGNDLVDGNQGADSAFLGAGNDVFNWDPGDASDVVEGQSGTDELRFNGSNANEVINVAPNGARSAFTRDVAAINMDMDDVETIRFRALGGTDTVTVANMTGTDVTQVIVDLAAAGGGGDAQVDRVTVMATAAADSVTVTNGSVNVGGLSATTRIENSEATDHLIISLDTGDDVLDASSLSAGQITLEMLGGLGADVMFGSAGTDIVTGGDGNDTALMGAGDDVFIWNPGDDNDVLEGQAGIDRLDFTGNGSAEGFTISANGGRILFFRDVAAVTMDMNDVEQITLNAGAGTDAIVVNDISGTDLDTLIVNLAGTIGGTTGDAQVDQITLFGDSGNENIDLLGITGTVSVLGLPAFVSLNQLDGTDVLTIDSGAGNDTINASQLAAGIVALTINGGVGDDTINGTAGNDTINGFDDNDIVDGNQGVDTVFLGAGNDRFNWNPGDGSDLVEGQNGTDLLFFNGSNANENIAISANGARVSFTRDVAAINMDLNGMETIQFNAIGGTDNITINNLTGTGVTRVILNLAGNSGTPDGLADTITVNCTALGDILNIATTSPGVVTLTGLSATVEIRNFDAKDHLIINAGDGNNTIDATGSGLAISVFAGTGNDTCTGGDAFDTFVLGAGSNTVFRSLGGDFVDPAGGTTTLFI